MKNAVENGFTVYVSKNGDKLIGTALRPFGNRRGIQPVYMEQDNLNLIDGFSFLDLLEKGRTLQMYRGSYGEKIYPSYIAQVGMIGGEGPYGEEKCFSIVAEGVGDNFYEALINLEEQYKRFDDVSGKEPFKKARRPYGQVTYR